MTDLPEVIETDRGATVVDAGAEMLHYLLETLEQELVERHVSLDLNPGISDTAVHAGLESVGLGVPEELRVLFGWRDGHPNTGPSIIPRFPFDSLSNDVRAYVMILGAFTEMARQDGVPPTQTQEFDWGAGPGWLRLWRDNYTVAVDCTGDPRTSPLVRATCGDFLFTESGPNQVISLCTPIAWAIEGIRAGAHVWDATTRRWDLNFELLPPLQRKYGFV